jgi:hypothetical protein
VGGKQPRQQTTTFPSLLRRINMEALISQAKALSPAEINLLGQWIRGELPSEQPATKPLVLDSHKMELAPPAGGAAGIPSAEDYRLTFHDIQEDLCMGRRIAYEDVRWVPHVFGEGQCQNKPVAGDDLCPTCRKRLEKYAYNPKPGAWTGRITEEPEGWLHMLGTAWAEHKKPKWVGPK